MATNRPDVMSDGWPDASRFRQSIRMEFCLYVSGIILAMMLVTGIVVTDKYVETVTGNVIETLLVQARSYSGPAGKHIVTHETPDALLLNNACKRLLADNPDVYWAGIAGNHGRFIAHTDIAKVIGEVAMAKVSSIDRNSLLRENERIDLSGDTIYISVPIIENGIELGRLGLASSSARIAEARSASIMSVASITIIMLLLGLPGTMYILHRKLKPVSIITDALKQADLENLDLSIPVKTRNEFGYLAETIEAMGSKLGDAQRHLLEKDRISRELEIAREIQTRILPREYPVATEFEFAGAYYSAREIGGDYYDFLEIDERRLAFLVADVSGKSLPGMLVMLLTRDFVRQQTRLLADPVALLGHVNRELRQNIRKGMFVTMFYGVVDRFTGVVDFASAGHNPLIVMDQSGQKIDLIKTKGFPLGLMPPEQFDKRLEASSVCLQPGDWLVQYTDGMNEAQNPEGEEYGMDRFTELLRSSCHRQPADFVQETLVGHQKFVSTADQYDDITLLTMKWHGATVGVEKSLASEVASVE